MVPEQCCRPAPPTRRFLRPLRARLPCTTVVRNQEPDPLPPQKLEGPLSRLPYGPPWASMNAAEPSPVWNPRCGVRPRAVMGCDAVFRGQPDDPPRLSNVLPGAKGGSLRDGDGPQQILRIQRPGRRVFVLEKHEQVAAGFAHFTRVPRDLVPLFFRVVGLAEAGRKPKSASDARRLSSAAIACFTWREKQQPEGR